MTCPSILSWALYQRHPQGSGSLEVESLEGERVAPHQSLQRFAVALPDRGKELEDNRHPGGAAELDGAE